MRLTIDGGFAKAVRRLPPHRQKNVQRALEKFIAEPRTRSLDFRSFSGAPGYFIIDPHDGDRIILKMIDPDHYAVVDVGPHDNIYRRWNR